MNADDATRDAPLSDHAPLGDVDDARTRRITRVISLLLRWGVRASLALFVAGSALAFARAPRYGATGDDVRRLTSAAGEFPRSARWLVEGVTALHGTPLIVAGLLLLIATPLLRVAVSLAVFAGQRERVFVLTTGGVLVLLMLSFVLGRAAP